MLNLRKMTVRVGLVVVIALAMILGNGYAPSPVLAATSPSLGAAGTFSVLAGSIVTNTGASTHMSGDLGISPSIGVPPHYTGILASQVGPPGAIHDADAYAALGQAADTAVFGFIDQAPDVTYAGVKDLVGLSLVPGVYAADAFELSGTLTLVGSGVWIFKSGSTLITSGTANIVGGNACNVWWRVVSSATLGTNTSLIGNILALTSIHLQTGATLNGRALAQTGQVTLDGNVIITTPLCGALPGPQLSLTKTVSPATYSHIGDVLNYTLVATNDGNTNLTNVSINDPLLANILPAYPQAATLASGATLTVTGTRTITQADLDSGSFNNTATALSTSSEISVSANATATAQQIAHLSLTKTASPTTYSQVGDVITYTLVATNDGNITLTNVSISDPGLNNTGSIPAQPATLAPGATLTVTGTHTITLADLTSGSFINTAAASGSSGTSATAGKTISRATSVGGEVSAINMASVLAPWLGLGLLLILGGSILTVLLLRRRTSR